MKFLKIKIPQNSYRILRWTPQGKTKPGRPKAHDEEQSRIKLKQWISHRVRLLIFFVQKNVLKYFIAFNKALKNLDLKKHV